MINLALGDAKQLPAHHAHAPTHVDFLIVGKETAVETVDGPVVFRTDHHTGPSCPKHLVYIVVLAIVLFHRIEHPAPAVRIAVSVEETTACTGILKLTLIGYRQQFRLTSAHLGMSIHEADQRCQPAWRHLYIGIEQHIILGIDPCQCLVITVGKPPILIENYLANLGKLLVEHGQRIISRGIVGDIDDSLIS